MARRAAREEDHDGLTMPATWRWSGDADRVLANLPRPLFRNRDVYEVARKLGIEAWQGQAIWHRLRYEGRIVRTKIPIGKAKGKCYWERSYCSVRIGDHNKHVLALLTKCQR